MTFVSTDPPAPRTRLSPEQRRSQLLDLGVRLLATRSVDELSIDLLAEEAGISRGLLYHYFGNKHQFHEAVVRRAADDLVSQTAPPVEMKVITASVSTSMMPSLTSPWETSIVIAPPETPSSCAVAGERKWTCVSAVTHPRSRQGKTRSSVIVMRLVPGLTVYTRRIGLTSNPLLTST